MEKKLRRTSKELPEREETATKREIAGDNEDAWLIRQAKRSGEAFAELYEKYVGRVYGFFFRRVDREKELAEDLTQDVFIRAWQHVSRFTDKGVSYSAYLMKIAKHLLVDHYAASRNHGKRIDLDEVEEVVPDSRVNLEKEMDSALMRSVLDSLRSSEREVAKLFYIEGQPVRAIAERLGKSKNAVKIMLHRIRKELARHPRVIAERPSRFSFRRFASKIFRASKREEKM
ncbi:MAG: sigma-70 family RNA polymerase sigma factor [Candidatus Colwellbacteria bacterium]|nr:sigma-70 family RNA polymerase sigma factor [Candidatus Colwellbacteria bacterium]